MTDWKKELEGFSEQELKQIFAFIFAIKMADHVDELKQLSLMLRNIFL
jgi:hypothetical protein